MPSINYGPNKYLNIPLERQHGILGFLKREIRFFFSHWLLHFTSVAIFLKFILFLGIINNSDTSRFSLVGAFTFAPSVFVYFAFIGAFLCLSLLFKGRVHLWVLFSLNLVVTTMLIFDIMYFRGYSNFISPYLLQQTANLDNLGSSIVSMLRPIDVFFVLDLILMLWLIVKGGKRHRIKERKVFLAFALTALSLGVIFFFHYKLDILEKGQNNILFRICWTPTQTMSNLSPIGYHIYDSYNYWLDNQPKELTKADRDEIQGWFAAKKENLPDNEFKGMFKGKNLLLLQVESLENFVIDQSIDGQTITPTLNGLLKNSLYFSNFYEQVHNGTSSDSDLMSNTSVYPVRRGSTFFRFPFNSYNSLPQILEKHGYSTLAIHPDKGAYWNWQQALTSIGFDRTIDASFFKQDELIGLGLSDGSYLRQVAPVIAKEKQPFYTFMVTLTSHGPFDMPDQYKDLTINQQLDKTKMGAYFQSIHYTDKQIGKFLAALDKAGVLDNTVVVIYGDHTGIHRFYQDEVLQIKPSEDWWVKKDNKIPLIIYQKGMQGKEIKTIGGHIDILPTVSYLMGMEKSEYENTAMGRNLLNTAKNFAVLDNSTYVGDSNSDKERTEAVKGIDIANKIIESNYFK